MRMSPAAMGTDVEPTLMPSSQAGRPGKAHPAATPIAMARKIQRVSHRSRAESRPATPGPLIAGPSLPG